MIVRKNFCFCEKRLQDISRTPGLKDILIEGWLLVSCSSSSSSMQGLIRGLSPGRRLWLLYMCRLRGPSNVEEGGPPDPGDPLAGALTAALLNGFEWSNRETAMDALVLAPVAEQQQRENMCWST